jgi:hypothetical protein
VDDKWLQTPRGLFALRKFFVGGTTSAEGEEVAWDAIRVKLREVVDAEDKQHPYSDDELVEQLGKHGLTVARRTITKYRKAMDIPSSRQRKDWALVAAASGEHPESIAANAAANGNGRHHADDADDSESHEEEHAHHAGNGNAAAAPVRRTFG